MEKHTGYTTIDEYVNQFPDDVKQILNKLRSVIQKSAPNAREAISYQMPTFKLEGNLVHFAAYKNHIGFYPTPSGIEKFERELSGYTTSKGAVQFPLNKPLPYGLIEKMVKFRVKENLEKAAVKRKK